MKGNAPALLVLLGGVSAALHVGKLPPAIPVLRDALGVSLLEAGFLLSLVQFAGMALGLFAGVFADRIGLKRTMLLGLAILSVASAAGGFATHPAMLLALRACEGLGFLLASIPAPGVLRRLVEPARVSRTLGWWGAYMPFGTATALLLGPAVMTAAGWPAWWWLLGAVSGVMALGVATVVPADPDRAKHPGASDGGSTIRLTVGSRGPWLVALVFATYSAQWLAVIGFLPSIYAQAGVAGAVSAVATAFAAGVNMIGNIGAGRLLHRGTPPQRLLYAGFVAMAIGALVAFAAWPDSWSREATAGLRYAGVLLFSAVGGMVPGTLFTLAVRVAPGERAVSTTIGWMQQWSAIGQFAGPPLVAWVAGWTHGWSWTGAVTALCALAGAILVSMLARMLQSGDDPRGSAS